MAAFIPFISALSYPRSNNVATRCLLSTGSTARPLKPKREGHGSVSGALSSKRLGDNEQLLATGATTSSQRRPTVGRLLRSKPLGNDVYNDVIGIDFGATSSSVSVLEGTSLQVIENDEEELKTPCVVALAEKGEHLVGTPAKCQALFNPTNTIFFFNLLIGRGFLCTEKVRKIVPYNIVAAPNGSALIQAANGRTYPPYVVAAMVLSKMKKTAEAHLGKEVTKAVIAVPAYFNLSQRIATKEAGRRAGLDVLEIVSEPIAALSMGIYNDGFVAVIHHGGATFSISIVQTSGSGLEVIGAHGDILWGGRVFDNALLDYLVGEFMRTESVDVKKDEVAYHRLREAAEKAKIELSSTSQTEIQLFGLLRGKHLNIVVTRSKFEWLVSPLISDIKKMCLDCLEQTGVTANDINEVLLVGGMTKVPKVQEMVSDVFGKSSINGLNPDGAVSIGAAFRGHFLQREPLSIGVPIQFKFSTLSLAPLDWRARGAVTPAVSQGKCGCCWDFSVVSAVESLYFIITGILETLSRQQVVDCAVQKGCSAQKADTAYKFIQLNGVCRESDYRPYTAKAQYCDRSRRSFVVSIMSYARVPSSNHNILVALSRQPLTAGLSHWFLSSNEYRYYRGGIIYSGECPYSFDATNPEGHMVCIVGWNVKDGVRYLIIKDSKGTSWGEDGCFNLAMTDDWIAGLGDINAQVMYPIMHK